MTMSAAISKIVICPLNSSVRPSARTGGPETRNDASRIWKTSSGRGLADQVDRVASLLVREVGAKANRNGHRFG